MNNKQYPTRMHEVLGVDPWERFDVKWKDCTKTFRTDNFGNVQDMEFYDSSDDTCYPANGWDVSYMVNHPDRITRRPRLTEEQVKQLQALVTLGFRWLFFTHATANDSWLYATSNKPTYAELEWDGYVGWFWSGERLRIKGSPLNDLERVCADAPLDIVQTLRDAGRLEVDDA